MNQLVLTTAFRRTPPMKALIKCLHNGKHTWEEILSISKLTTILKMLSLPTLEQLTIPLLSSQQMHHSELSDAVDPKTKMITNPMNCFGFFFVKDLSKDVSSVGKFSN